MNEWPLVSVIMPVRNEGRHIRNSLEMVLAQDYPADRLEILVADGMSEDGTRACIRSMQTNHPNLILIDNPGRIAPTGLNAAIREARGEIVVRIDGHAIAPADYVRECVTWLAKTGADCVGGAVDARGTGLTGEVIALAMSSPFGVGGSGFRVAAVDARPVLTDTVPFGAYRRDVFDRIGRFNAEMVRHQDYEFCYRLRRAGGRIMLLPHLRVAYFVRSNLRDLWKQYWQYGVWKGRFLHAHPASLRWRHAIPPALLLFIAVCLAGLIFFPSLLSVLLAILAMYLAFIILASVKIGIRYSVRHMLMLAPVLVCLHVSWGTGVWRGLLNGGLFKKKR